MICIAVCNNAGIPQSRGDRMLQVQGLCLVSQRGADHHRPDAAAPDRLCLFGKSSRRAGLLSQKPGSSCIVNLGAVHLHIKRSLHGENLFSRKSCFRACLQALLSGKHAGSDSGRIPQSFCKPDQFFAAGRHQNVSRNRRQKSACLVGIRDIDKVIIAQRCMVFGAVRSISGKNISLQVQIWKAGFSAGRPDLPRDDLRMGVRRIDHTGKRPFPHQLRHTAAVESPCMDGHEGMRCQNLFAVMRRHAHSAGNSRCQQSFRRIPSFCCPSENQNTSASCFHLPSAPLFCLYL